MIIRSRSAGATNIAVSANRSITFGCAWTACITVPIAVRRATSTSPIPMSTERPRIECALQDDARLFAGVRAIVFHSAEQLGLPEQAREGLADATLEVCREVFAITGKSRSRDAAIKLIVGGAPDRIEITIDYPGDATATGNSVAKACAGRGGTGRLGGVDQVRCENSDGRSRVTLVKQCNALESKSGD